MKVCTRYYDYLRPFFGESGESIKLRIESLDKFDTLVG